MATMTVIRFWVEDWLVADLRASQGRSWAGTCLDGRGFGSLEQSGEVFRYPLKDSFLFYALLEEFANEFAVILGILPDREKGGGDAGEVFIEVGNVVNEWQSATIMNEAEAGQVTERTADGGAEGI